MNLYAILPEYAPGAEVTFVLAETDAEAMQQGVYAAAHDVAEVLYCSPTAAVYCVASDVRHVGTAHATDAPREWAWAYPAVLENAAEEVCAEVERAAQDSDG